MVFHTTYSPALAGAPYDDSSFNNPGVITMTRSTSWASQGPESIQSWWVITPTVTDNISVTLELCYTDAESNGLSLANLRFWRFDDGTWSQVGGIPTTGSDSHGNRYAQISGVNDFSTWTLATGEPTAVQVNRFSATTTIHTNRAWVMALPGTLGLVAVVLRKRKKDLTGFNNL
jgi:hypothetical protein